MFILRDNLFLSCSSYMFPEKECRRQEQRDPPRLCKPLASNHLLNHHYYKFTLEELIMCNFEVINKSIHANYGIHV